MEDEFMRDKEVVIPVDIEAEMKKSFLEYSMSVIVARALPDARDGLKPVHRRILYTMFENGLSPDGPYRKCADTVGSVLGKYHPHGDASVYDALVRLAQPFRLRYPLVDGQGNFGSIDGDPPAAYRYTEAKMQKLAWGMLDDIKKDTVEFMPNYDERLQEPTVLPSRFPNLLCNGSVGIAVGMATNIPPHNLNEVADGIKYVIQNPDCSISDIMQFIKGPDFPTGGIIMGKSGIRSAYATGRGKITLRSRTNVEKVNGRDAIIVTEIPYMINKAKIVEDIAEMAKDKRIDGIHFVRDESGRQGMRIVIELKKGFNPEIVKNRLFALTQLQDTVGVNMLALVGGEPKCLNLKQCLENYIDFQKEIIRRRTEFDLKKALERAHILQGFCLAIDYIDEVIAILRSSQNIAEGKERLIEHFKDVDMTELLSRSEYDLSNYQSKQEKGISEEQAEAIVQMRLGSLTGLERSKTEHELYDLLMKITDYRDILANESRVKNIIIDELDEIVKKYGDERRTSIEDVSGEVDVIDLIPNVPNIITFTENGYIKRVSTDEYKTQRRGGTGSVQMKQRDEDNIKNSFSCMTHDELVFLTSYGKVYLSHCYKLPDGTKGSRGSNIVNFLNLAENEKLVTILHTNVENLDDKHFMTILTKNGKVKRTPLSEYKNIRTNGLIAAGIDEGDEIISAVITDGKQFIIIATNKGMALKFDENDARPMGRNAHGVKAIDLEDGDFAIGMVCGTDNDTFLTVTDGGFGRRSYLSDYRMQQRGGKGVTNYKCDDKRGYVQAICNTNDDDDIIFMSDKGMAIRTKVSEINTLSRTAKGVIVMKLRENEKLTSVVTIPN